MYRIACKKLIFIRKNIQVDEFHTRPMNKYFILLSVLIPHVLCSQIMTDSVYQRNAVYDNLPSFSRILSEQQTYPFSWLSGTFTDFTTWRTTARARVMECLLKQPAVVPFHPVVMGEQDRGSYIARKLVFNISADSRVLGYLLVPKGRRVVSCRAADA